MGKPESRWSVGAAGAAVAFAMAVAMPAQATVITFDSAPQYTCGAQVTDGLVFTSGFCLGVWPNNPVSSNGTPGLIYGYGAMQITQFDGGSFHLESFLAGISWYSSATTATITYNFDLAGGGASSGTFDIGQGFASYTFNANITKAVFSGLADGYVAIDNVTGDFTPAPVPEPASLVMMLGGFGAIVVATRRSRRRG